MKTYSKAIPAVLVAILFLLTGCATPKGATSEYTPDKTIDATHPRARLVLGSSKLTRKIVMTNVRFGSVGQLPRAEVGLQNLTNKRFELEYKIDWLDQQGFSINTNNAWHRFSLTPRQNTNFQSVGKVPEAYQIIMNVRIIDDYFIDAKKHEKK